MRPSALGLWACVAAMAAQAWAMQNKPAAEQHKAQAASAYKAPLITEKLRLSDFAGMEP